MKRFYFLCLSFLPWALSAQERPDVSYARAQPEGGVAHLARTYFDIDFTPEQRKLIQGEVLKMNFVVSAEGIATLQSVDGVEDFAILDSLFYRDTALPAFSPEIRLGTAVSSIYYLQFTYPRYNGGETDAFARYDDAPKRPSLSDYERVKMSRSRLDVEFGFVSNAFLGRPAQYLSSGIGFGSAVGYTGKNQMFYGLNMVFQRNRRIKMYDIDSPLKQNSDLPSLFLGASVGRWLGPYIVQFDANYVVQTITQHFGDQTGFVHFRGFSPGIVAHRVWQLGGDHFRGKANGNRPHFLAHHVDLHLGLRYLQMSHRPASGFMAELGLSYRLGMKMVGNYRLKDAYFLE